MAMAYKDSLFRSLFGNEKAALALYNALHGTNYQERDTDITMNTLEESMLTPRKNDLSFLVNGKLVVLIEHQSSVNGNMPIRFLHPILRLLEGSIGDKKALYRKPLIKLPRPRFIVLYNGTEAFPERSTLWLSDAFEKVEGLEGIFLELAVEVYNINEGHNAEIAGHSEELRGYAYFVDRVRYHEGEERKLNRALDKASITRMAIRKANANVVGEKTAGKKPAGGLLGQSVNGGDCDVGIRVGFRHDQGSGKGREVRRGP